MNSHLLDCHSPPDQVDKSYRHLTLFIEHSMPAGSILLELALLKSQKNVFFEQKPLRMTGNAVLHTDLSRKS